MNATTKTLTTLERSFTEALEVGKDYSDLFVDPFPFENLVEIAEKMKVIGTLKGWGQWTHVIKARIDCGFGPSVHTFFVR